jgi:D-glycero-D-manno-heptose 1,7-bisphosphate phosphatase
VVKHANRAVFLDRDGVINVEKGYLHRIEDLAFLPGVPEAIGLLKDAGYLVIVITNQSGVARGYYTMEAVSLLHRHMEHELAALGARIDAWYVCPHHPEHGGGCSCRKPLPGMIEQAAADFRIDPARSYMIGDKLSDVEAGLAAGCRSILVGTGYGADHGGGIPDHVPLFPDLLAAARAIVEGEAAIS